MPQYAWTFSVSVADCSLCLCSRLCPRPSRSRCWKFWGDPSINLSRLPWQLLWKPQRGQQQQLLGRTRTRSRRSPGRSGHEERRREDTARGGILGTSLPVQKLVGQQSQPRRGSSNAGSHHGTPCPQAGGREIAFACGQVLHPLLPNEPSHFATSEKWKQIQETEKHKLDMSLRQTLVLAMLY